MILATSTRKSSSISTVPEPSTLSKNSWFNSAGAVRVMSFTMKVKSPVRSPTFSFFLPVTWAMAASSSKVSWISNTISSFFLAPRNFDCCSPLIRLVGMAVLVVNSDDSCFNSPKSVSPSSEVSGLIGSEKRSRSLPTDSSTSLSSTVIL